MPKTDKSGTQGRPWMKPTQELLLPVHGYVFLSPVEMTIINHPAFQRLRRCRQLGLAHTVFPGGVHTRFEHSIGALFTAQQIMTNINWNFENGDEDGSEEFVLREISEPIQMFVRVAALLHDIGHLPFGHTLEDETSHLPHHDDEERLKTVAEEHKAKKIKWGKALEDPRKDLEGKPLSLKSLIDHFYAEDLQSLYAEGGGANTSKRLQPFDVVKQIVSKNRDESKVKQLPDDFPLDVCRDLIGNTICADFLDYLHRDWYHLGRPLVEDKRIYQYMEVRAPKDKVDDRNSWQFLINVGRQDKRRLDAFTTILQLLDSRYKLSETVIFHRSKLAMIALLDRCLIELRTLYKALDLNGESESWNAYFQSEFESLLLEGSDDDLYRILMTLADGGRDPSCRAAVAKGKKDQEKAFTAADRVARAKSSDLLDAAETVDANQDSTVSPLSSLGIAYHIDLIHTLAERMRNRVVYHEAANWRGDELKGVHDPNHNKWVDDVSKWYKTPKSRGELLNWVEHWCGLASGSVTMYVPVDPRMNAKVAEVGVFIDGKPTKLNKYEESEKERALTCGAVTAQRARFFHLWNLRLYVEQEAWEGLDKNGQRKLAKLLKDISFYDGNDHDIHGQQVKALASDISKQAARGVASADVRHSGLPAILSGVKELANGIPIGEDNDDGTG